jgi:toxin ParE1/3/4
VFRPAAERDLLALYEFICDARGEATVAIGYVRRIRAFCESIATFPIRGTARDDIRPGLRLMTFERRVVIAFETTPEVVRIGRIFYGGRDYVALLGEFPDNPP